MSNESFIQKQIQVVKNKEKENAKSLGELLSEAEEHFDLKNTTLNIGDINQEYLFDSCSILSNRVSDVQKLNGEAYFIANSEGIPEYTKLKILKKFEKEYQQTINTHKFFLNFVFPDSFIDNLKYIFEVNEELILNGDIVNGITTAFVKIQHYNNWCEKHRIQEKHFPY